MTEIVAVLNAASEVGSENLLRLANVKHWLTEYLQMHEEDVARFPKERNRSHWDLLGADYDPNKKALFLLVFFRDNSVTFLSGRGNKAEVHDFAENTFPKNPDDVLDEASHRFWVGGRTVVALNELLQWLNG